MYDCVDGIAVMKKEYQEKKYQVSFTISGSDIESILTAAFETGTNHQVKFDFSRQTYWKNKPAWLPASRYATQILIEGGKIQLNDIRDPIVYYELTLHKLIDGINDYMRANTWHEGRTSIEAGRLPEQMDGAVANEIITNAIFGRR